MPMGGFDGGVLSQQWGLASGPIMATRGMAFRRGLIAPLRVEPAVIGTFLGPERAFEFWPEQDVGGASSWEPGRGGLCHAAGRSTVGNGGL
jgi:hypothetical protein